MPSNSKIIFLLTLFISTYSQAQNCTYKQAQTKMVEFNNMMQVKNREKIAMIEKTGDSTPELEAKLIAMVEESVPIGILLSDEFDNNENIQYTDSVNPEICKQYDALMNKHAPSDYTIAKVEVEPSKASENCTTNKLWERFGKAIQKQQAIVDRITKAELPAYMKLQTEIGQYATTDLAKACIKLAEFEKKLDSE